MSTGVQSSIAFLVFAVLYLGQALLARFGIPQSWVGKILMFANQWFSVACIGLVCGGIAGFIKMNYFSKGHFGTSMNGLAWSGPSANAGIPFTIFFVAAAGVAGYFLYRAPKPSLFSDLALFFVPGLCVLGGTAALLLNIRG